MTDKNTASRVVPDPIDVGNRLMRNRRLSSFRKFLQSIKETQPSIYDEIAAMVDPDSGDSELPEKAMSVVVDQLENKVSEQRQFALQVFSLPISNLAAVYPAFWSVPKDLQEKIVRGVLACLRDLEPAVTREAVSTLGAIERGGHNFWRANAVRELSLFERAWGSQVVQALASDGVNNQDAGTAKSSIELLGCIEINLRSMATPSLVSAIGHANETVREAACDALGHLGEDGRDGIPSLVEAVASDLCEKVRITAVLSLLQIQGVDESVNQLRDKIKDRLGFLDLLRIRGDEARSLRLALHTQWLDAQNHESSTVAEAKSGKAIRKASINARMMETIQSQPESMGWNSPKWAEHLKCGKSSVVETITWKDLAMRRIRQKAERAEDRRRRPKASDQRRD